MNEYLLIIKGKTVLDYSPEALQQRMEEYRQWVLDIGEHYVAGQRLEPKGIYIKDKDTLETDGPFLEAKEILAGYVIIKANSLEQARDLALSSPLLHHFELMVRPMIPTGK